MLIVSVLQCPVFYEFNTEAENITSFEYNTDDKNITLYIKNSNEVFYAETFLYNNLQIEYTESVKAPEAHIKTCVAKPEFKWFLISNKRADVVIYLPQQSEE